jgi:archaellum component FlaC
MIEKDNILNAIGDLAEATGKGFEKMHSEFAEVNDCLSDINQRLERIEERILKDHLHRIERLEKHTGVVD